MGKKKSLPTTDICGDRAAMKRYQAEDDLRTLQRAKEISGDKGRMNSAASLAKEQMQALQKIAK